MKRALAPLAAGVVGALIVLAVPGVGKAPPPPADMDPDPQAISDAGILGCAQWRFAYWRPQRDCGTAALPTGAEVGNIPENRPCSPPPGWEPFDVYRETTYELKGEPVIDPGSGGITTGYSLQDMVEQRTVTVVCLRKCVNAP